LSKCPVLDEKGLVKVGNAFVLHFPFNNSIVPLKVLHRANEGSEEFEYGPPSYTSGTHEAGVIPASTTSSELVFSYSRLEPATAPDMWYHRESNKVYHVFIHWQPEILRVYERWPKGTTPQEFRGVIPSSDLGTSIEFGFTHGTVETAFPPVIRAGWLLANPTNIDLRACVSFTYGEYETEFINDPQVILDIIRRYIPNHQVRIGGKIEIPGFEEMLDLLHAKAIPIIPSWTPPNQALAAIKGALQ